MFAIVVDEDVFETVPTREKVSEVLRSKELRRKLFEDEHTVQVAFFDGAKRKWVPACLGEFAAAN